MTKFYIKEDLMGAVLIVHLNCTFQEFKDEIRKSFKHEMKPTDSDAYGLSYTFDYDKDHSKRLRAIWLPNFNPRKNFDLAVLMHECVHFGISLMRDRDMLPLENNNEEAYARASEWAFLQILDAYKKLKK